MTSTPAPAARESRLMHGVLEMCVLAVLDESPLHAYGIVQRLRDHGFSHASYGSIYPLVTRLRKSGQLDQRLEPGSGGPARNVLAINAEGRAALATWMDQWEQTTEVVGAVVASRRDQEAVSGTC
ncbi:PadR family transcriptional regulator [Nocardioides lijunqiniae]|uniref:PadR family transcriptional regulator n=1 Tax=Nocardioides lijunqiniae TaxID=2760832 RepID=UPI001877F6EE|nr:PadR family transcriptional regulator [Nocardioides lijunqiniae]